MTRDEIRDKYTLLEESVPFCVWLIVGGQRFRLAAKFDEIEEAAWYRERLVDALENLLTIGGE